MNDSLAVRGVVMLCEWTIIATAILFVTRLLTTLVRRNAAMRHLLWLIAFTSLLAMPALLVVVPARFVVPLPAPITAISSSTIAEVAAPPVVKTDSVDTPKGTGRTLSIPVAILGVWFGGMFVIAIVSSGAGYGIRRIRRQSTPHSFEWLDLTQVKTKIGLRRKCALRISSSQNPSAAMTWGFLRPMILLPRESVAWPKDRLEAVLLHELAHVRRCDSLSQWLALTVCALYWFHPAVWHFAAAMRAEAELAADDAVLSSGVKPSAYAAELLRIAAEFGQKQPRFAYSAVSFMRHSRITARIESILIPDRGKRGLTPKQVLLALSLGFLSVVSLTLLRPSISLARPKSVTPPSTANSPNKAPGFPGQSAASRGPDPASSHLPPPVPPRASTTKHCSKKTAAAKSTRPASAG